MGEMRNVYGILVGGLKARDHVGYLDVDGR
jgi:hypothetical protein